MNSQLLFSFRMRCTEYVESSLEAVGPLIKLLKHEGR